MVNYAYVKIWGYTVGAVAWDNNRNTAVFEYDDKFVLLGIDLAPITMPLAELQIGNRIYSFPGLPKETFMNLPGLLLDALPDRYGNMLIDAWLARQGRPDESFTPVERLCYMGKRSMGALEFEPVLKNVPKQSAKIEITELVKLAQKVLSKKEKLYTCLGSDDEKALKEIIRVGTSAGGARAKAVIALNDKTNEIRSGQVNAPNGFEHWILKFDGVDDIQLGKTQDYGRIEYAYHKMAVDAGIYMTECRILEENNRAHFMTKRFDRKKENEKIHMQTLCAIAHYDYNNPNAYSYEQLFQVMRKLRLPYIDAEEMYRRMCFNIIASNMDDHTKNVSFMLEKEKNWRLTPAYDVIYSFNPKGLWTSKHQLSVNGKRENIQRKDLLSVGKENNIKHPEQIIERIVDTVNQWEKYAQIAGLNKKKTHEIYKNLNLDL